MWRLLALDSLAGGGAEVPVLVSPGMLGPCLVALLVLFECKTLWDWDCGNDLYSVFLHLTFPASWLNSKLVIRKMILNFVLRNAKSSTYTYVCCKLWPHNTVLWHRNILPLVVWWRKPKPKALWENFCMFTFYPWYECSTSLILMSLAGSKALAPQLWKIWVTCERDVGVNSQKPRIPVLRLEGCSFGVYYTVKYRNSFNVNIFCFTATCTV